MATSQPASVDEPNETPKKEIEQSRKNDDKEGVFCYCREPAGRRFMIGCDECNEWYHGDCVEISRAKGREIDVYVCPSCISKDANLSIVYFDKGNNNEKETTKPAAKLTPKATPKLTPAKLTPKSAAKTLAPKLEDVPTVRCNECLNCVRQLDCGKCYRCTLKTGRCVQIDCLCYPETNVSSNRRGGKRKQGRKTTIGRIMKTPNRKAGGGGIAVSLKTSNGRKNKKSDEPLNEEDSTDVVQSIKGTRKSKEPKTATNGQKRRKRAKAIDPMHISVRCIGPGCNSVALPMSKYCSDECGMKLAKMHISAYLPRGIEDIWRTELVAAKRIREEEALREKQDGEIRDDDIKNLDKWYKMVIDYVNSLKEIMPEPMEVDTKDEAEMMVLCSVCNVEFGSKSIEEHTVKCTIAKSEKQATFGTSKKCIIIPSGIFCEEFNESSNTYCKSLRVNCPKHYKGDIEEGLKICGWPKIWNAEGLKTMDNLFTSLEDLINGGRCGISRKECKDHAEWITSILGLIDARRIVYYSRMEELYETKRNLKRGDGLLIMSNATENLQPLVQINNNNDIGTDEGDETMMPNLISEYCSPTVSS